ncbi:MAG: Lpp/OprI family alanine-zipper lipoprotein [Syntrophotaleaceae bacterium]
MKKVLLIVMMVALPVGFIACATTGDLEKMQAEQRMLDSKVEQALQDAQAAKVAADEAKLRADETSARADAAIKAAEERERLADEKAQRAEAAFQKSMMK